MNLNERRAPVLSVASKTFLKTEASRGVAGKQNKKKKHFHTSVRPLGKGPLLCRSEGRSAKAERPLKGLSVRGWTKPALVSRLSAAQFPKVYFEWTYGRILWLETFTGMLWTRMFRKKVHSRPLFRLFSVFPNKHYNFYNKVMRKNILQVSGAGRHLIDRTACWPNPRGFAKGVRFVCLNRYVQVDLKPFGQSEIRSIRVLHYLLLAWNKEKVI